MISLIRCFVVFICALLGIALIAILIPFFIGLAAIVALIDWAVRVFK